MIVDEPPYIPPDPLKDMRPEDRAWWATRGWADLIPTPPSHD